MLPAVINGYEWDGKEIEILYRDGEPLFNATDIGRGLAIGAAAVREASSA